VNAVELSFMLVTVGRFDNDAATDDTIGKSAELGDFLADSGLDRRGGIHIAEANVQRKVHAAPPYCVFIL
jgi:hypothetical protein